MPGGPSLTAAILAGHEHVAVREFFKHFRRLSEIRGEYVLGICCNPLREIDGLVDSRVKSNQDARRPAASIHDRVAITMRDVADVPRLPPLFTGAAVRA